MPITPPNGLRPDAARYRWDRLGLQDAQACTDLVARVRLVEEEEDPTTIEQVRESLSMPGIDPARDTWGVWDGDRLVGYGVVSVASGPDQEGRVRCSLHGVVDPVARNQGIGQGLLELMEERATELAHQRHPGIPADWTVDGRTEQNPVRALLTERGYALARYWHEMTVALPATLEDIEMPEGYLVREATDSDSEAIRATHNAAFEDHWGSAPTEREQWDAYWSSTSSRLSLSRVVQAPDGGIVAYVILSQHEPDRVYISIVGTAQRARGKGLARACLSASLAAAGADGRYRNADLHVDSVSPTGATRLYELLGFKVARTVASYRKPIPQW